VFHGAVSFGVRAPPSKCSRFFQKLPPARALARWRRFALADSHSRSRSSGPRSFSFSEFAVCEPGESSRYASRKGRGLALAATGTGAVPPTVSTARRGAGPRSARERDVRSAGSATRTEDEEHDPPDPAVRDPAGRKVSGRSDLERRTDEPARHTRGFAVAWRTQCVA